MAATGTPSTLPRTSWPACPSAVERGNWGILAKGILVAPANSSAKAPRPEPSTTAIFGRSLVLPRMNLAATSASRNSRVALADCLPADMVDLAQNSDDRSGHEVGHGAGQHGADAEFCKVVAAVRGQGADSPDLNAYGAEVREAAKGESGDGKGPRV